jgi:tetratricopeptide (TPR) repeat protein
MEIRFRFSVQASLAHAQSHEAAVGEDVILNAIASLRKVRPEVMGAHWGILADCHAMAHEPGACAKIWEDHGVEIVTPLADSLGRSAADILSEPARQLQIADLWAAAELPQKEIETLESLRGSHPRLQGVNRRLADCYMRAGDLGTATQRIQDEACCDEAFRDDPIVRLLLRQCGNAEEADRRLKEAREKYENSVASGGQRNAIRNVLQLTWKPFVGLSPSIQEDWVKGLHWCYGEHPLGFDETERAEEAIYRCTRALESHLREKLFEPLREAATATEIKQLPKAFEPLRSFLEKRSTTQAEASGQHITLTVMLDAVLSAGPSVSGVFKRLWDLLNKRSSKPHALKSKRYLDIAPIRNPNVHESRPVISGITMAQARRCVELCAEFFSVLETPPLPAGPGQPAGVFRQR